MQAMTHVHERSVIETRQSKATMPEDNSPFLKRKRRAASGGIRTRDVLRTKQTLYQLHVYMYKHVYCTSIMHPIRPAHVPYAVHFIVHVGMIV